MPNSVRYIIIHYHIFKNAGSTLEAILERNFGRGWTRFDARDPDAHLTNAELLALLDARPDLTAISSHQLHHPTPRSEGLVCFDLLFLRDPLDRIRSMYYFLRREPPSADPFQRMAKRFDLGGFISHLVEDHPHQVNDAQVNILANGGIYRRPPGAQDLSVALERAVNTSVLGVVELFNASLIAARYFLKPAFADLDIAYRPANVSAGRRTSLSERMQEMREACGEKLFGQLLELNALDLELVERARSEVERRFGLVPDHAEKLSEFEARLAALSSMTTAMPLGEALLTPA